MTDIDRRIRAGLALALAKGCVMCAQPADCVGLFQPFDSQEWGAPAGKARLILYGLCERCEASTSVDQREARLEPGRRAA